MRNQFSLAAALATVFVGTVFVGTSVLAPEALAADARHGAAMAREKCAACHATGRKGASPNIKAPTFRRIAGQWPVEQLQEALAEGIVTGHGPMPEFAFSPTEIDDLLAHLKQLRRR
jgi:cytochrome c